MASSPPPAAPALCPDAKILLVTDDGAHLDVTAAVKFVVAQARAAGSDASAACPPELAALCEHLGRCEATRGLFPAAAAGAAVGGPVQASAALTMRESEIVSRLREGRTNKEIGRALGIKEDTVKKHLQSVYDKLGVRRRAALAGGAWLVARP